MHKRRGYEEESDEEKIDPEYNKIAHYILSHIDPKSQESVSRVLSSKKALETYQILQDEDIPNSTIRKIMLYGISHLAKGRPISVSAYATAIAQELTNNERYADVIDEMYEEGVLSERQYESVKGELEEHSGRNVRRLSYLEHIAKAASWFGISLGIVLMLSSATGITGAVIGFQNYSPAIFTIGFVAFFLGMLSQK